MKGIVIGAGQSHKDENVIDVLSQAKKRNDTDLLKDVVILSTDRTLKYVLEKGIIPEYCGIQENLYPATRYGATDYLKIFFDHDIVKKHASEITLYHAQALRWQRTKILSAMGFKMVRFNRHGCGGNLKPVIVTCGHCAMALVEIGRHILKLDKIATIGMDMDLTGSWKIYKNDVLNVQQTMLQATIRKTASDLVDTGKPIYNLTRLGKFHCRGVEETNIDEFLKM